MCDNSVAGIICVTSIGELMKNGKAKPRLTQKQIEIHREAFAKGYLEGHRSLARFLADEAQRYVELETDKQMDELRRKTERDG
jgi:hypothetical protein